MVTMNMISNTSITSINGVVLISGAGNDASTPCCGPKAVTCPTFMSPLLLWYETTLHKKSAAPTVKVEGKPSQ